MKFLKYIALLGLVGCTQGTSPVCEVSKVVSSAVAVELAVQLDCKNASAIELSLMGQLESLKLCESKPAAKSIIGELVCPRLVDSLVNGTLKQFPASWQCSGGTLKETAIAKLASVCKNAL